MGLTFSSGAVDAISYLALGKIFTAFMTGNLVFLGLSIAATATLIVLASDVGAGTPSAIERRRLAGVLAGLLAGAAAGALLLVHARPYAAVLPLVVTAVVIASARVALMEGEDAT